MRNHDALPLDDLWSGDNQSRAFARHLLMLCQRYRTDRSREEISLTKFTCQKQATSSRLIQPLLNRREGHILFIMANRAVSHLLDERCCARERLAVVSDGSTGVGVGRQTN